jgi:c-di-GMP-binding flagellar brake protein YcgR
MEKEPGCERRRWYRLPICFPVFVRWIDERQRKSEELATTVNISAGGVLLAMYHGVQVGNGLSIQIPNAAIASEIPHSDSVNHLSAEVLRVENRDKVHVIAAKFMPPLAGSAAQLFGARSDGPVPV